MCARRQVHWPDRYVSLFGGSAYDVNLERPDDVPFEEQLRGLEAVVKAGKVPGSQPATSPTGSVAYPCSAFRQSNSVCGLSL